MLAIGSIGIITVCGLFGLWLAERSRGRPRELREFLTLLSLLDTEIVWGATPLPEAFASLSARATRPWQGFFADLKQCLQRGQPAGQAWRDTVDGQRKNFCLKAEDWPVIADIGKGLGRSDRHEQHKQLELGQRQLDLLREQAAQWAEKQAKMWSYLGFLTGIAVVILLL